MSSKLKIIIINKKCHGLEGGVKKEVTDMQDTAGIEKEDVFLLMVCDPGGPQAALWPQSLWLIEQPVSRCGSK